MMTCKVTMEQFAYLAILHSFIEGRVTLLVRHLVKNF